MPLPRSTAASRTAAAARNDATTRTAAAARTATATAYTLAMFISDLQDIGQIRVLHIPATSDTTTTVGTGPAARTWTHTNTLAGRVTALSLGAMYTNNGTTDIATATDAGLPTGASGRTIVALIKPSVVNVVDNPVFMYGTQAIKQAFWLEMNNARYRIGFFGANAGLNTATLVAGTTYLISAAFDSAGTISYFTNGVADGTSSMTSVNTTLAGAAKAIIAGFDGIVANNGSMSIGFIVMYAATLVAAQAAAVKVAVNRYFGLSL